MARKRQLANVIGKEVQRLRYKLGLTQEQFAARCQLHGLDISRGTVSQIEAQVRCVIDSELYLLASILGVSADSLCPPELKKLKRKAKK